MEQPKLFLGNYYHIVQQMHYIDSYILNMSSVVSGAHSSAGRLSYTQLHLRSLHGTATVARIHFSMWNSQSTCVSRSKIPGDKR